MGAVDYPDIARQQGAVGTAWVDVGLDALGKPYSVKLWRSSGNATLDQSALRAARRSRYAFAINACSAVPSHYLLRVNIPPTE